MLFIFQTKRRARCIPTNVQPVSRHALARNCAGTALVHVRVVLYGLHISKFKADDVYTVTDFVAAKSFGSIRRIIDLS